MKAFALISALIAAATALPSPFPSYTLEERSLVARDDSNCTTYCSVSAGCVCTVRPSDCTALYTVQSGDTCTAIAESFGNFTVSQLYQWNPDVGRSCFGLQAYVPICINTPWYTFTPPVQAAAGTHESADQIPVPLYPNTIDTCTEYEIVGPGMRIDTIAAENNVTVNQLGAWNGNATASLWEGYWACVKAPQ